MRDALAPAPCACRRYMVCIRSMYWGQWSGSNLRVRPTAAQHSRKLLKMELGEFRFEDLEEEHRIYMRQ